MKDSLPPIIQSYVRAANARDLDAVLLCFDSEAVVRDEGQEMRGIAAIRLWKERVFAKYRAAMTPTAVVTERDTTTVSADVAGTFPGSPISLRYHFSIHDGKITTLEVGV